LSRPARVLIFGAAALALVTAVAVLDYRARKLAILEPRQLEPALTWSGEAEAPCTLLMIGDSHVARWRTVPPRGWRVARTGLPGEAAVNIAAAAPAAIRASAPDAVLIAAGTNDASAAALQGSGREATLEHAAMAIERMIRSARSAGAGRVLVTTLVPPRSPELWRRLIYSDRQAAALGSLSDRIAKRVPVPGAELFDAAALARDATGAFRPELRADALHWSPAGYEILDAALWHRLGACPEPRAQRPRTAALRAFISSAAALAS
jgi:lysophospholipase L1-like esterase